jgi:hypothetical protein
MKQEKSKVVNLGVACWLAASVFHILRTTVNKDRHKVSQCLKKLMLVTKDKTTLVFSLLKR